MDAHRLRAPSVDGALLAEPPLGATGTTLAANIDRLGRWDHDFQGRRAGTLRALVRRQVLDRARDYLMHAGLDVPDRLDPAAPLFVTGHQPELFHPGVWIKNFAIGELARERGGAALNLIVDNDLLKATTLRIPHRSGGVLGVQRVDFDVWGGEVPYEDLDVRDEDRFASFADRARAVLGGEVPDPVLNTFWPRAVRRRDHSRRLGLRFAQARRELEASWGTHNLEVPLSTLCETESFLWFAAHLLAQLPRFQEVHNAALARYRAVYGIRSRHHPVPALARAGEWREAPFWVWRAAEPRRRPLLVRQLARTMELRIEGEDAPILEIPLGPDREACCAVEQLHTLPDRGIRLRTRALTTTMFARLLLGDLFVHGIGGAKYDELGDEVIRGFFGIEPPDYLTLSMTLWLGLEGAPASLEGLKQVGRSLRDLSFNPERYLTGPGTPEVRAWIAAKREAIAAPQETRQERRDRFTAIRRCNEALQPLVDELRGPLARTQAEMAAGLQQNALAHNREYAFVLHSEARLRAAISRGLAGA